MEDQYPIQPEETNLYDEPSDDDLCPAPTNAGYRNII